jgi:hypothetical protein
MDTQEQMMRTVNLNTEEAPNKFWALQDRRMRNVVNKSLYSYTQQTQLGRIKLALEEVINGVVYDVGYGKKSAAVKVQAGAQVRDRKMLALLEADWAAAGIYKKVSPQGFQYHLTRA